MIHLPIHALTQAFTILTGVTAKITARAFTGNDLVLHFTVVDADGDPVSIAAWTTRAAALYTQDSGTAVLSKTPAFVTDGSDGEFTVTITDADTSAFAAGVYRLEIQMTGTGIKTTVVRGSVVLAKTYA